MINLNSNKFNILSIGALLVIFGVVVKNSLEQLDMKDNMAGNMIGMLAFILGWAIVSYAISIDSKGNFSFNRKTIIVFLCAAGIVFSVMQMKQYMTKGQTPPMIFPLIFAGSWLLLGYMTGNTTTTRILGLLASITVLLSMMLVLPWQRKNGVIDGPGMPLFVTGWVLLAFANSLV